MDKSNFCTIFLLYLCITGLPLIFHEEIEHLLEGNKEAVITEHKLSLDKLAEIAVSRYPGEQVRYAFWDENEKNKVLFDVVDKPDAPCEKVSIWSSVNIQVRCLGLPRPMA